MNQIDTNNRIEVCELVKKYFGLNGDSKKRFEKLLFEPDIDESYKDILGDSVDLRKRWKVSSESFADLDKGWSLFKDLFSVFIYDLKVDYENFRNNFIMKDGNKVKLRKALLDFFAKDNKKGERQFGPISSRLGTILDCVDNSLHRVNNCKLPSGDIEIVLSLNFVDWFLCSTGESWSSCLRLDGNYPYWAGLPGLTVDKNISMLYITNKSKKTKFGLTTDKFISRTWVLLNEYKNKEFGVVRWFPGIYFDLDKIKKITKKSFFSINSRNKIFKSKHSVDLLNYKEGESVYIYMDSTYFDENLYHKQGCSGFVYYVNGERIEEDLFRFEKGLNGLIEMDAEITDKIIEHDQYRCDRCNRDLFDDEVFYFDDTTYCENCYSDYVGYCSCCDRDYYVEDMIFVESMDESVCSSCLNEQFFTCQECGKYYDRDSMYLFEGEPYCQDCIDEMENIYSCEECEEYFKEEDMTYLTMSNTWICNPCLKRIIEKDQIIFDI